MRRIQTHAFRGALALCASVVLVGIARPVFAAREAANEVGRWVGFGHQAASLDPGTAFSLDLTAPVGATPGALIGVLNALPAVQMPLQVTGSVTPSGRLTLNLKGDGVIGFCDGSVRNLLNFGRRGGQDDIGELSYLVVDAAGLAHRGHLNMIHLFGGLGWGQVTAPNVMGAGKGSALPPGADVLIPSSSRFGDQLGSSLGGALVVGHQEFALLGTVNEPGSLIMMCDGSVRNADGRTTALIGLLFTGGVLNLNAGNVDLPAVQHVVGNFNEGGLIGLLRSSDIRPGTLSLLIGLL